jgi:prepilin-type N-terminal cleavage/methylation domain-containing protein
MTRRPRPSLRRGFTLIELLVVISIVAVLASLIAPAVQTSRRAARRVECINNMRNVGLAVLNFTSATGGQLPALSTSLSISNATGSGSLSAGWPILILPAIDSGALWRSIQANSDASSGNAVIASADNVWLPFYTCPDDTDSYRQSGGLSYVVNAGFISSEVWGITESSTFFHQPYLINWKGGTTPAFRSTDGTSATGTPSPVDLQVALASGVFWRVVGDPVPAYQPSIDYVTLGDGASTTLMITENLSAGLWTGSSVNAIGFGIRIPVDPSNYAPLVGSATPCGEFSGYSSLDPDFSCSTFVASSNGSFINQSATVSATASLATTSSTSLVTSAAACDSGGGGDMTVTTTTTSAPRPSSQHPGGVNAIMVDGSARFLNSSIDPFVYARLVTSNGVSFRERTLEQSSY